MRTRGAKIGAQISDDEAETKWAECPQCEHQGWMGTAYCPQFKDQGMNHSLPGPRNRWKETGGSWTSRLARGLRQLTRSKKTGNKLPPVGQRCLVLRGEEGHDLGQPAIITMQTRARVWVAYLDSKGRKVSKVKVPSSLMLLEDGLDIVRDEDGFV
jgi:hypothetical protein